VVAACGSGGQPCQACGTFQVCGSTKCDIKPDSSWAVTVLDGEILKPPLGKDWDPGALPGFLEPDVYVEVKTGAQSGDTKSDDNTHNPYWNKQVLTAQAKDLMLAVNLKVMDEDLVPPDQLMGQCTVAIAEAELTAGARTVVNCGGSDVMKINLTFTAQ